MSADTFLPQTTPAGPEWLSSVAEEAAPASEDAPKDE